MAMNPNDPLRGPLDPEVPFPDGRTPRDIDNQLQIDPELDEERASGGRIALYGLAILAVLGAIFYGLNSSPTNTTASNTVNNPATTAQTSPATPMAPGGLNTAPGTTTGAAPAPRPAPPMNNNTDNNIVPPGTTTPNP